MEVIANSVGKVPRSQALIALEFPDDAPIEHIAADQLPTNWYHYPYPAQLSRLTEHWLTEGATWIMQVPSAQSPTEYNYLFNPQHPRHYQLRVVAVDDELFDPRLKR